MSLPPEITARLQALQSLLESHPFESAATVAIRMEAHRGIDVIVENLRSFRSGERRNRED